MSWFAAPRRWAFFCAALCSMLPAFGALAQSVTLRSGEHADFTRLVAPLAPGQSWELYPAPEGRAYFLRLTPSPAEWGLEGVFDRIPRSRLSGLSLSEGGGALRLDLGCDCHARAFETGARAVAIDIRAGPDPAAVPPPPPPGPATATAPATSLASPGPAPLPPPGPPLAAALSRGPLPLPVPPAGAAAEPDAEPAAVPPPRAEGRYDWLAAITGRPGPPEEEAEAEEDPFTRIRESLLAQISRGVAEGVIDIKGLSDLPAPAEKALSRALGLRVANGEMPGLVTRPAAPGSGLNAGGRPCLGDDQLALADWAGSLPPAFQIAATRQGMFSEFDRPEPARILSASRSHLALGFGAEARQYLQLLPGAGGEEAAPLLTLSWLIDLDPPGENAFAGMESCDSAAALWAALALSLSPQTAPARGMNSAALVRGFSALPPALRAHLGPQLADFALISGDMATAHRLRDGALRALPVPPAPVNLVSARLHLLADQPGDAGAEASRALRAPGPGEDEALVMLVEAGLAGEKILTPGTADQIASFQAEAAHRGGAESLRRAEVLAAAMSGEFSKAFERLEGFPAAAPDLWALAVERAPDDLFLTEAIALAGSAGAGPAAEPRGDLPQPLRGQIARRLLDHGFADQALQLLSGEKDTPDPATDLLRAEAALAARDPRAALRALDLVTEETGADQARGLRARAYQQLGLAAEASAILASLGEEEEAARLRLWSGGWDQLALEGQNPLSGAAALSSAPLAGEGAPPLARGHLLLEDAGARAASVRSLIAAASGAGGNALETVPRPD